MLSCNLSGTPVDYIHTLVFSQNSIVNATADFFVSALPTLNGRFSNGDRVGQLYDLSKNWVTFRTNAQPPSVSEAASATPK